MSFATALFALVLLAAPSLAAAQRVPDWAKVRGRPLEVQFYQGLARCMVLYWPLRAQDYVDSKPGSDAEAAASLVLRQNGGQCVASGAVRLQRHRLRGTIAEVLLEKGRGPARAVDFLADDERYPSFAAKLASPGKGKSADMQARRDLIGRWVAHCAVRADTPKVEALLQTEAGAREELKALAALDATLTACLGSNRLLPASAPSMRGYLAEALYWRRSMRAPTRELQVAK